MSTRPRAGRTRLGATQVDGQDVLFAVDGPAGSAPPAGEIAPEPLPDTRPATAGEARTRGKVRGTRQDQALAAGWHPLSLTSAPWLKLHPEAAPAGDRNAPGRRCGSCRFRAVINTGHAAAFPKCVYPTPGDRPAGGWPRVTNGDGTDVRRWWPACTDHQTTAEYEAAAGE